MCDTVTSVFASSDVQAVGAWKAVADAGLRVPDDVALVGYDDIKISRYLGLTSVDVNALQVGRMAASLLLDRIAGRRDGDAVIEQIVPRLRVRSTSSET